MKKTIGDREIKRKLDSATQGAADLSFPNLEEQAVLGFMVGSLYGLRKAIELDYQDRTGPALPSDYSKELRNLLVYMSNGNLPKEGHWLAGFYFNSALQRLAALYHRSLKILTGHDDNPPALAEEAVKAGLLKKAEISALATVHKEVNKLKHDTFGVLRGRSIDLDLAVEAAGQALFLIRVATSNKKSPGA